MKIQSPKNPVENSSPVGLFGPVTYRLLFQESPLLKNERVKKQTNRVIHDWSAVFAKFLKFRAFPQERA